MDQEQQIAYRAGGTLVCQDHVTDDHLRVWIGGNPVGTRCDFCDRTSDAAFSADLGELAQFIFEGFERDWTDAANELPPGIGYDNTRTTLEMLYEEEVTEESELADALAAALPDYGWVQRDFLVLSEHDRLVANWRSFTELVKHHNRFFFPLEHGDPEDPDSMSPLAVLEALGRAAEAADLLAEWPADTIIYRARVHDSTDVVTNSWHLAALPEELADRAAANRMSAPGVPMFYGALDADGAIAEAISAEATPDGKTTTLGQFSPVRPLQILDLSHGIAVPSQFDPDRGHLRAALAFLRGFVDELAQPVRRDGYEHVGYVPTQVVCDYFRGVHRFEDGRAIDGIAYPSTQAEGATNVVLFVTNLQVEDANGTRPPLPDRLKFYGPYFPRDPAVLRLVDLLRPGTHPGTRNSM